MAQQKFAVDINAAMYPLLVKFAGRGVMQPQLDGGQEYTPFKQPQILYCENVLPVKGGYKSVSYRPLYGNAGSASINFTRQFTVTNPAQVKAKLGVTTDNKIYMLAVSSNVWVDITPIGWTGGAAVTVATVNGQSYMLLANFGFYLLNTTSPAAVSTTLAGITIANISGCFSAENYLCLYDATTIYWCSTLNPLDFTPSLITGAGSMIPADLDGTIVAAAQLNNGFAIYSTANIVLSTFSNNTQFPWVMVNANNSSGIKSINQVSMEPNLGFHIAHTYAGILRVTNTGCTALTPEVTDFLAERTIEVWNPATNSVVATQQTQALDTRIAVINARYIVLSYGVAGAVVFNDALVYDLALNRWGKLHIPHVAMFEITTGTSTSPQTYLSALYTYAGANNTYNSGVAGLTSPPSTGETFGVLAQDGSISVAVLDDSSIADKSILLLGKVEATRNNLVTIQEAVLETVDVTNTAFSVSLIPSLNGKDLLPLVPMTKLTADTLLRKYGSRVQAKNHIIVLKGSFKLTYLELAIVLAGRR